MPLRKRRAGAGSLNERAYQAVRNAILAGKLPPGSPLSRRRLAAELGMSTLPIADALTALESEGLVESRPRAGTRVRIPTADEVLGSYVVREALETHSARLFAESASAAKRRELRKAAKHLDTAFGKLRPGNPDADRHAAAEKLHLDFHMLLAGATGCKELAAAIERSRVLLFNWLFSSAGEYDPLPARWHSDLADTLAQGSPAEAAEAMRAHVTYRKEERIARFKQLNLADRKGLTSIARGPQRSQAKKVVSILNPR